MTEDAGDTDTYALKSEALPRDRGPRPALPPADAAKPTAPGSG
jgi:hypothetical protein